MLDQRVFARRDLVEFVATRRVGCGRRGPVPVAIHQVDADPRDPLLARVTSPVVRAVVVDGSADRRRRRLAKVVLDPIGTGAKRDVADQPAADRGADTHRPDPPHVRPPIEQTFRGDLADLVSPPQQIREPVAAVAPRRRPRDDLATGGLEDDLDPRQRQVPRRVVNAVAIHPGGGHEDESAQRTEWQLPEVVIDADRAAPEHDPADPIPRGVRRPDGPAIHPPRRVTPVGESLRLIELDQFVLARHQVVERVVPVRVRRHDLRRRGRDRVDRNRTDPNTPQPRFAGVPNPVVVIVAIDIPRNLRRGRFGKVVFDRVEVPERDFDSRQHVDRFRGTRHPPVDLSRDRRDAEIPVRLTLHDPVRPRHQSQRTAEPVLAVGVGYRAMPGVFVPAARLVPTVERDPDTAEKRFPRIDAAVQVVVDPHASFDRDRLGNLDRRPDRRGRTVRRPIGVPAFVRR